LVSAWGGMALGAMTGTGSRGNLGFKGMGALQRPMQQAFLGGAVGLGGDMVSNTFGGPSLGLETAGARLGLGAGLLGNAARSQRVWANKNHMLPAGWTNFADDAASGIKATYDGGMAPFTWAGNKLRGASNRVFGTTMPMSDIVPQGLSPRNRALFGAGGLATGIPLAGTGIGIAANAIQHPIREAARGAVEDGLSRANEWAQQRGLMGEDGRFHAAGVGAATVDRMIQGLGMDPSQMSQADKWSLLGGGMMGGLGVATGNPMLAAGGLGAMGYGGRNGLMELLGHAARFSTGKNTNQLVQNAMTPGDVRMNGQGWQ
jgi:hypothetical protein